MSEKVGMSPGCKHVFVGAGNSPADGSASRPYIFLVGRDRSMMLKATAKRMDTAERREASWVVSG